MPFFIFYFLQMWIGLLILKRSTSLWKHLYYSSVALEGAKSQQIYKKNMMLSLQLRLKQCICRTGSLRYKLEVWSLKDVNVWEASLIKHAIQLHYWKCRSLTHTTESKWDYISAFAALIFTIKICSLWVNMRNWFSKLQQ